MSPVIRFAAATDVAVILDLIRGLAEYERLPNQVVATEERLRQTLFGDRPSAEVLLAEIEGGEAVGFAVFFGTYSTYRAEPGLYLEDLYVRPAARGRGIGRALLRHVAGIALGRGCSRIDWLVLDWNEEAMQFYRQFGAEPLHGWTKFRLAGSALAALAEGDAPQ